MPKAQLKTPIATPNRPQVFAEEPVSREEHIALKAVWAGEANAGQQRMALKVIVSNFSRAQDQLYIPGSFDETAFINGRAYVGLRILRHLDLPIRDKDDA